MFSICFPMFSQRLPQSHNLVILGPTFPGLPHGGVRGVACRDVAARSQEAMEIAETSRGLDTMSVFIFYIDDST